MNLSELEMNFFRLILKRKYKTLDFIDQKKLTIGEILKKLR